jgi:TonB-dependent SusC/RagA subfamily outer membrane receptor
MKKIIIFLLLLSSAVFSQNFDKNWDKVIAFEKEGKIKSAHELVEKIHEKAVSKKDEVQIIKCFFYESKYSQVLDENAQTKIINNLKTEIDRASIPSKALLNLIYAKCLDEYYNQNDYTIRNRTNIISLTDDFLTWTKLDFNKAINTSFESTLTNENILRNTFLSIYEPIFDFSTLENLKKENLFCYLVEENISFYTQKVNLWEIQPKDFKTHQTTLLGASKDFINLNLDFIQNENLKKVLGFYQKKENGSTTAVTKLQRILFCYNYILKSDTALLSALERLQKEQADEILLQKILLEKAKIYTKLASKETYPDYNTKAIAVLDSITSIKNNSNAYKLALQKKQELNLKSLSVQLQKQLYNKENARAFINYKNVASLKISYYKINQKTANSIFSNYKKKDSIVESIRTKQNAIQSVYHELVNKKDYFEYTTEVLLPPLETGNYLVYFESDSDEKTLKAFAYETITVSNLALLAWEKGDTEYYQVLDRKTGQAVENANITSSSFNLSTSKNGIASYKRPLTSNYNDRYENLTIAHQGDSIQIFKNYLSSYPNYSKKEGYLIGKVEFYLDRAIYRPGQIVYYKGIAFQKEQNKTNIVPKTSFKITIRDANGSDIKEFVAITNDFGSFSGEFILPKTGLTGDFSIEAEEPDDYEQDVAYDKKEEEHPFWDNVDFDNSKINFKVEEYKRPKFEVTFEPIKESYQVNQNIQVKGIANAFAGSTISEAKVEYTVKRFTQSFSNYYNQEEPETLASGETTTDASGKFSIDFTAKPSANASKEQLPIFKYRINASITDVNGETHAVETTVNVGYHDLILKASIPNEIETKNKNEIILNSTNLNGQFIATQGSLKLYFTKPLSTKFKSRTWPTPDIEIISNNDFERYFPYEYNKKPVDESDLGTLLYTKTVNTAKDKIIPLDFISEYQSGNYKIIFTDKDPFDNLIKDSTDFQIIQSKDPYKTDQLFTLEQINTDAKKDGFVLMKISSSIPDLFISTTAKYKKNAFFEDNIQLKNKQAIIKIMLQDEFENDVKISFQSIFENQTFQDELAVTLKNKEPTLSLDISTFRNKIEPGKLETWSFKLIPDKTSNKAEVLASMYDSSLDQFTSREWNKLFFHENNYYYSTYKSSLGFDKTYSKLQNLNRYLDRTDLNNEVTQLMWFGFNFNNSYTIQQQTEYQKQLTKKAKKPLNAKMISGIVSEKEIPIPGVTIFVNGTQRSTTTGFDGYYEIEAAIGEELNFSSIGYKPTARVISSRTIDVQLVLDQSSLNDVVVIGYGTQKKSSLTGAIKKFTIEEDNTIYNAAAIEDDLQGKVAGIQIRGTSSLSENIKPLYIVDGVSITEDELKLISSSEILSIDVLKGDKATALYGVKAANGVIIITTKKALEALTQVKTRTNLSETAFFYPNLKTDSKGNISFNFTSPEALTAWKLRLLAHNKEAVSGYLEKNVITQKELMVVPNFPRFFREKDSILITAKVSNMTAEAKTGIAQLQFFDASTMAPIDISMANFNAVKNFNITAYGNSTVSWKIYIPEGLQGIQYKVLAKAGNYSDGEESILPVLTNTMLVTESIPIWVRGNTKKEYTFENLKNNTSTTLRNHQFTLEYTSNPAWMAIQSLPYLMEYEHECAEQTFARFYSNALASEIISSNPKIASLFDTWRKNDTLKSKLEENEELKSLILAETPWVRDAQSEEEKKKNLALLFDLEKMKTSQEATFDKLKQKQNPSGGFAWFAGGQENEYISRHILAGLGHLLKLSASEDNKTKIKQITTTGIPFIDQQFLETYKHNRPKNAHKIIWTNPYSDLHYLYTRSFYLDTFPLSDTLKKATKLYLETAKKEWLSYSLYEKGLAALTLNRFGEAATAKIIIENLKETSSNNEDWGMYWMANKAGWHWYQAPIETQALLIEAFAEVTNDTQSVDAMKVWLLKNKQTKNWPTTKSTTEAVYALLLQGSDWLSVKDNTVIKIGDEKILTKKLAENEKEAETGYIKLNWKSDEIKKNMATISVENKSTVPAYGGAYWQYFEDLDKIKSNSAAVLSVSKELYLKKNTDKGEILEKITTTDNLKIGDLVTVRLLLSSKEDMEFVHLKDMRASCFEPVDVLSGYQYKEGLVFYKSTKDAATHFFFDQINKGTYVLEYDIRVNNSGDFSNGISTIESMYAPEFSSHTKGIRVQVK